jgi:sugar lactone lactonase YvrE
VTNRRSLSVIARFLGEARRVPRQARWAVVELLEDRVLLTTEPSSVGVPVLAVGPAAAVGSISTVAGKGPGGYTGDGGAAIAASLNAPVAVAADTHGNLFIADSQNNVVREVKANGTIVTVAGNGTPGYRGDGGPATDARLSDPSGVAVDGRGNLYIADTGNAVVREVTPDGTILTVAGNGSVGLSGDYGPATRAQLNTPTALAVDHAGDLFIADTADNVVREVRPSGNIVTVAGYGPAGYNGGGLLATKSQLKHPQGIAVDSSGQLFIADTGNGIVREIMPNGILRTVVAPATSDTLIAATAVAVDAKGDVFIVNQNYEHCVVREVTPNGIISTVAGGGAFSYMGDGGPATGAGFADWAGITVDAKGNLFIADTGNNVVREIETNGLIITVAGKGPLAGAVGQASSTVLNEPNDVALDSAGDLFVTVSYQSAVIEILPNGATRTVAGTGAVGYTGDGGLASQAELAFPTGIAVDAAGNLFIADSQNNVVREVIESTGTIITVAGSGKAGDTGNGGPAARAALDEPNAIAVDAAGDLFIADTNNNVVREVMKSTGTIVTVAGNGQAGYSGDGGPAAKAELDGPAGVAVNAAGDVFIADTNNNIIREVLESTGTIVTVAGNATPGYGDGGGLATAATLFLPRGIKADSAGNLFIAALGNDAVWELITSSDTVVTIAGIGNAGYAGDGGAATKAELDEPGGVAVDGAGNVFIADTGNRRVREVGTGGTIHTLAGGGSGASLASAPGTQVSLAGPGGLAVDRHGDLFIADSDHNVIRELKPNGIMVTVAGTGVAGFSGDGGPATQAAFHGPTGLAVDAQGDLFIADTDNNVVREVKFNGIIVTVAGDGTSGYTGDGGRATTATLNLPQGVAADAHGDLFIADTVNSAIREVMPDGTIRTIAGRPPTSDFPPFDPTSLALDARGNLFIADTAQQKVVELKPHGTLTDFAGPGGNDNGEGDYWGDGLPAGRARFNGPSGVAIGPNGDVVIADTYNGRIRVVNPAGIITTLAGTGQLGFSGDNGPATHAHLNGPEAVAVDAQGDLFIADAGNNRIREVRGVLAVAPAPTATQLTDSASSTVYGQSLTFTASVRAVKSGAATPGGSVVFMDGTSRLGSAPLVNGIARLTTKLPAGVHSVVAVYQAAKGFASSTSAAVQTTVNRDVSTIALVSASNPTAFGQAVKLTATVRAAAPGGGLATGAVTFFAGMKPLGTATLKAGIATLTVERLGIGRYAIHARYGGDRNFVGGSSRAFFQTVTRGKIKGTVVIAHPHVRRAEFRYGSSHCHWFKTWI